MDLVKSAAEEGDDVFVYRIKGSKGQGYATVDSITNEWGDEDIQSVSLRLDTGEEVEVIP